MAFPTGAWIPKGLYVRGKVELLDALRQWLKSSDAPTIGDTSRFHGAYWVTVEIDGLRIKLAADTTRGAVRQVVAALKRTRTSVGEWSQTRTAESTRSSLRTRSSQAGMRTCPTGSTMRSSSKGEGWRAMQAPAGP
jgi:hypothetical protein